MMLTHRHLDRELPIFFDRRIILPRNLASLPKFDVRHAAADGIRPHVFRVFQFWGRMVHVSKQRGGIVPAAGARDIHQY
jgi:hypothetical protein